MFFLMAFGSQGSKRATRMVKNNYEEIKVYLFHKDMQIRVKEVRNCIDDIFLPSQVIETRWVRFVPIKVNIFIWRARQDCLPTRVNLVRRGINVDSCVCPICSSGEDEINHILFRCDLAQQVLRRICRWWELDPSDWNTFQEWYAWFSSIRFSSKSKSSLLEGHFLRSVLA
ncbi:RNA-directed DNA polymerase, eukaryota [Tanacetum coccineum]